MSDTTNGKRLGAVPSPSLYPQPTTAIRGSTGPDYFPSELDTGTTDTQPGAGGAIGPMIYPVRQLSATPPPPSVADGLGAHVTVPLWMLLLGAVAIFYLSKGK